VKREIPSHNLESNSNHPDCPAHSLVTILAEVSWLLAIRAIKTKIK